MATVFFSWQADRPGKIGRNFVENALRDAIKQLSKDADLLLEIREEVEFDKDTLGIPGSPSIVDVILEKIDNASVFVPDLTFTGAREDGRLVPNPNVLIEWGWALKSLTLSRIVSVMNVAYGGPDSLPFDMRHLRHPVQYCCKEDADEATRQKERKELTRKLREALTVTLRENIRSPAIQQRPLFIRKAPLVGGARFRGAVNELGTAVRGGTLVYLRPGPAMWLRLMPNAELDGLVSDIKIKEALLKRSISPLNFPCGDLFLLRGSDGFGMYSALDGEYTPSVAYCFDSGEVWTVDTDWLFQDKGKVCFSEREFIRALLNCTVLLKELGVVGPYNWIAGIEGVKNRMFAPAERGFINSTFVVDDVTMEGDFSGIEADAGAALAPFFKKVFDKGAMLWSETTY